MADDSVDVTARVYHTEYGTAHAEGETYAVTDRALAETLRGIGFVSIEGWTEAPPPVAPVLASLTPSTAVMGAAGFTLQVAGTGFTAADVVAWNGAPLATTFGSATALSAPVDAAALTAAASVPVTVGASNALPFTVTAAR
jgi:hypothetical protein